MRGWDENTALKRGEHPAESGPSSFWGLKHSWRRKITPFKELWDIHRVPDPLLGRELSIHKKRQIWGSPSLILQFNFDQLKEPDGCWLLTVLFKDLQGEKDGSALQSKALGELSQGSWPFSGVCVLFCFRDLYTWHWGLWAAGIHLI